MSAPSNYAIIQRRRRWWYDTTTDPLGAGNTKLLADLGVTPRFFYDRRKNVTSSAGALTAWGDVTGAGTYGAAITPSVGAPAYNGTYISTDGASSQMRMSTGGLDLTQPWTVALVAAPGTTRVSVGVVMCVGSGFSANQFMACQSNDGGFIGATANATGAVSAVAPATHTVRLILSTLNVVSTGNVTVEVPGTALAASSTGVALTGTQGVIFGASNAPGAWAQCDYYGLLVWPGGYTAAQRDTLKTWATTFHSAAIA